MHHSHSRNNPKTWNHRLTAPGCLGTAVAVVLLLCIGAPPLNAEGPYRNRDNPNPDDPGDGTYPVPYQLPTVEEITSTLERVRDYLEVAAPARVINGETGEEITDFTQPIADAVTDRGEGGDFDIVGYTNGVTLSAMLRVAEVTGDRGFSDFTERRLQFIADRLPYFRAQQERFELDRRNSFRGLLKPEALDDCGAMGAAFIRARLAGVGPDLLPTIQLWTDYIAHGQFRLEDGTLTRRRPQAWSLWADDAYMSIPALAEMGRLTGEGSWYDDAVKNALQMAERMFDPHLGIYRHGWHANVPDAPQVHWGRANGWVVLALCDLLDVLPADHPGREAVLEHLRALLRGLARHQSGQGLWHQVLDRPGSYLESSATAMFVYGFAHAINQGWISPTTYGSIAQAGWAGLLTRIGDRGQVEGTCVGTTLASDYVYYYHRPALSGSHAYGAVLLAGAEMIELLRNPTFEIQYKLRTYHYVPKDGGETDYREHR